MTSPARTGAPHSAGLRRDMEVLRELASDECLHRDGLGVVRIALRLGREKSQVSRALRALEDEGLVRRDPRTRTYKLGWGLYTLAARGVETHLVLAATGHLNHLADEQQADVRLCVLIGGRVLTLVSLPSAARGGAEAPARSPCGAVLTLDWPEDELRTLEPDGALSDNLLADRTKARAGGYVHHRASDTGPARYAAPVRDFRGVVLAAIQLALRPGAQPPADGLAAEVAIVAAADALSGDLGFTGPG